MNRRLDRVQEMLSRNGILPLLRPYRATMAGSIPIGLDTDESDVDVLCEIQNPGAFLDEMTKLFGTRPGFSVHLKTDAIPPAVVCRFTVEGLPVEIFGQALPVTAQRGFRHMVAEQRLLAAGGDRVRNALMALRARGAKTEPAFGELFGLDDPYEFLLGIAEWPDEAVRDFAARLERTGSVKPDPQESAAQS